MQRHEENIGDFVPQSNIKSAAREIASRIADVAIVNTIVQAVLGTFKIYYLKLAAENMRLKTSFGVQSFVSLKYLRDYPIPLPPLAEQHRIVAKVDSLMKLCEQIEEQLKFQAEIQESYANAVVSQVAGGSIQLEAR